MVRRNLLLLATVCLLFISSLMPIAVLAQNQDGEENEKTFGESVDEKLELTGIFFSSALDSENLFVTFDDFFDQNECKRLLVFSLRQRRDRLGNAIRKAILNPDITTQEVRQMVLAWEVASGELYFVRNIEVLDEASGTTKLIARTNQLYPNNELLIIRSATWPEKYNDEWKRIQNCQPSWSSITSKWREFTKNVVSASDNLSKALGDLGKEGKGLFTDIIENPIDTLTPLDEAGLRSLYTDAKDLKEGEEFDFSNYLRVDFSPENSLQNEYNNKVKRFKELTNQDPVALQIAIGGDNVKLTDLATNSYNSSSLLEETVGQILDATKSDIEYGYADAVINQILTESEASQQIFAGASQVLEDGISPNLQAIITRQCRSAE